MEKGRSISVLQGVLLCGWIFLIGLLVGRALAIMFTHDDVADLGDFFQRVGIWSIPVVAAAIALGIASIVVFKKKPSQV